jgi:hypothetical protein
VRPLLQWLVLGCASIRVVRLGASSRELRDLGTGMLSRMLGRACKDLPRICDSGMADGTSMENRVEGHVRKCQVSDRTSRKRDAGLLLFYPRPGLGLAENQHAAGNIQCV